MLHSWSWSWSSVPKLSVSYFVLQLQGEFSIVSRVVRSTDVDNVGEKVGKISQVSRSRKSCKSCENLIFAFRSSFKVKSKLHDVLGSFVTVNDVNVNDVEAKVCRKDKGKGKGKVAGTVATNDVKDVKDVKNEAVKVLEVLEVSEVVVEASEVEVEVEVEVKLVGTKLAKARLDETASRHGTLNLILNLFSPHSRRWIIRGGDIEENPGPRPDPGPGHHQDQGQGDEMGGSSSNQRLQKAQMQVISQNVRGFGCSKKVRHLINKCYKLSKKSKDSIFAFQETFVPKLDLLRYLWRGEYQLTEGTGNSLGCITLVTPPYKILRSVDLEQRGHLLVLTKNDINKAELIFVNVYAPNGFDAEKLRFFEALAELIEDMKGNYQCENVIVAGDLNLVFEAVEVSNRVISPAEQRVATAVQQMMQRLGLTDAWRLAEKRHYTWTSSRSGRQAFSTLDRVLFNEAYWQLNEKVSDWALCVSDHAAVIASFNNSSNTMPKSNLISRLDPRLLDDREGKEHLDQVFHELFDQSSPDWDPHVRLEYCKMSIRTAAATAMGTVKARYRDEEAGINKDINDVIEQLAEEDIPAGRKALLSHKLDDLRTLKRRLVDKIGARLERRSARQWYNEGELSNKYFFNLLNRKTNDDVNVLINGNGAEVTDPKMIEVAIREFYKDLYESVPERIAINDEFFRHIHPVDEANDVTRDLTMQDLEETLKTCADSSPGPDGIPYSYLKHFWPTFGKVLLKAWQFSLTVNRLPPSHRQSYLRLIPKAGKDPKVISNLRPITLSNTDHKLITKTYARKMTQAVANKIGEEQTAYIPGRLINDNVRSMLMTIDLASDDVNVDGVVVSLDAKKAFDSVDHRFIRKCLEAFGLDGFIPIFNTLYSDLYSDIIVNGRTVSGYKILKGVKQGDALSCVLFIMCMEPLLRNLSENQRIERISSRGLEVALPKAYGFADDVTVVTKRDDAGIQEIFNEYEIFTKATGLALNVEKTEILCFNKAGNRNFVFNVNYQGTNFQIRPMEKIKINGVIFQQDGDRREQANVQKVADAMERHLKIWSTKNLTLLGKIIIIKTFAMSQATYLMQSMTLCPKSVKKLMAIMWKFLWNKNFLAARAPERIKRSIMLTPVKFGGFGMIDLKDVADSLDLRSYARLMKSKHPMLSQVKGLINEGDFFNVKVRGNVDKKLARSLVLLNISRRSILDWPADIINNSRSLKAILMNVKVTNVLTVAGKRSVPYFVIQARHRQVKLGMLTAREFQSIERHLLYPQLGQIVRYLLTGPQINVANDDVNALSAYVLRQHSIVDIGGLSSKILRENLNTVDPICIYKLGTILTPGELLCWTRMTRKLTSSRHKNILLRVMHGDIFSNERLHRFGLRDSPACSNCDELVETREHRIIECQQAREAWRELEVIKDKLSLTTLSDLSLENLVGAKDPLNKLELALQAELMLKLSTKSDGYCPKQVARAATMLVLNSEKLNTTLKEKFEEFKSSR